MRKVLATLILAVLSLGLVGCHKATVPAPIPGQINTFDGYAYRSLMDAQAAINSLKANVASGQLTLNASQRVVFNQIVADYNTANALWQTYHAGATGDQAALTSALTTLVTDISTIATQLGGK